MNKKDYSSPRVRAWRDKNKMRDCYHNLKSNSKRRGKEFNLTFEQFEKF
jgi:hypothetical protein